MLTLRQLWRVPCGNPKLTGVPAGWTTTDRLAAIRTASSAAAAAENTAAPVRPFSEIPHPPAWPLLGNIPLVMPRRRQLHLLHASLQQQLGNTFRLRLPGRNKDMVCICDPKDIQTLLDNDGPTPYLPNFESLERIRRALSDKFKDPGLITQGKDWQVFRKAVQQDLMRPKSAYYYVNDLSQLADDFLPRMEDSCNSEGEVEGLNRLMQDYTLESMSVMFLGSRLGVLERSEASVRLVEAVDKIFESTVQMNFLPPAIVRLLGLQKKAVTNLEIVFDLCEERIQDTVRRMETEGNAQLADSLLGKLMARHGPDSRIPVVMAIDALFAGIPSTSSALTFLLYHLATNPDKQEILHMELAAMMSQEGGSLTPGGVSQLKYLPACVKESQRLLPVAIGSLRTTQVDMVLGGYSVPTGTKVLRLGVISANDPKSFPNPEEFIPERWLRLCPYQEVIPPYSYLPFGHGPRSCIGQRFALMEMYVLAAKVVTKFRLEYHQPEPVGMDMGRGFSQPDREVLLKITPR